MCIREICRRTLLDEVIKSVKIEDQWKMLLVDTMGCNILSSCCTTAEVFQENVAMIEDLYAKREGIQQFEAIYLIQPIHKSIEALISDFEESNRLYKYAHVFFLYSIPDALFDRLCQSNCSKYIKTLKEVNIAFLPVESQLFSLEDFEALSKVYEHNKDEGIEYCDIVAEKIATLCCTLEEYPLLRYVKDDLISLILARKLRERLERYATDFPMKVQDKNRARSQLLIVCRNIDCISPVLHELTLQAMVYDILPVVNNTYQVEYSKDSDAKGFSGEIALDESDTFWLENRHRHIHDVSMELVEKSRQHQIDRKLFDSKPEQSSVSEENLRRLSADVWNAVRVCLYRKFTNYNTMVQRCVSHYATHLKELVDVEQDLALAITGEEKSANPDIRAVNILTNKKYSVMEKTRILLLYIMYSDHSNVIDDIRDLMDAAELSDVPKQIVSSFYRLMKYEVKDDQSSPFKKRKPVAIVSRRHSLRQAKFKASRWTPILKDIMESVIEGELDEKEFPFLGENLPVVSSSNTRKGYWGPKLVGDSCSRLIIYVIGGATYSEARCAYEVTNAKKDWQVILGSDVIVTPELFLRRLAHL